MHNKNKAIIFLALFSIAFGQEVNLSPLRWGEGEIDKYIKMDNTKKRYYYYNKT